MTMHLPPRVRRLFRLGSRRRIQRDLEDEIQHHFDELSLTLGWNQC